MDIYVKIARLYLEDEESVQAEAYINRAAELIHQVQDDALRLKYKVCFYLYFKINEIIKMYD